MTLKLAFETGLFLTQSEVRPRFKLRPQGGTCVAAFSVLNLAWTRHLVTGYPALAGGA